MGGESRRIRVVGSGQSSVDHLCVITRHPRLDGKQTLLRYEVQPGGQVPTALVALARWGVPTAYVGTFADDPGGILVRGSLAWEGIDLRGSTTRRNRRQPVSVILVDQSTGERSVLSEPPPPGLELPPIPHELLARSEILLHDATDMNHATQAAYAAKEFGVKVVLDIDHPQAGVEELLRATDVLVASRDFFRLFTNEERIDKALRQTARLGPWFVAATLGVGGAFAVIRGRAVFVPAHRVLPVDTTGAGDVFHAGCIYGLLQGWAPERILRFAAVSAALKCRSLGGRPGIPSRDEVEALLGQQARGEWHSGRTNNGGRHEEPASS